ncbi:hypothetical protein [Archangium lansingense]|uniref:Lipoprotein n=1 Tax=Archangium lansingense TaxID=2995310 RepID=A0ABT4AFR6_9BACT|nr:hypothetical protein [Archangium lansinium]MCY1080014.1 hypothetical protein [Archangium lansinium]
MHTRTFAQKLLALSLGILLVSCSVTQPLVAAQGPTGQHDLARYALIVQEMPDGQIAHDWKPLKDFDLMKLQSTLSAMNSNRGIVRASSNGLKEYCEGRRAQCEQDCLASSRPVQVGNVKYDDVKTQPWRKARTWWCPRYCMDQAVLCNKGRGSWAEEYAAEFHAIEPAVDWIKTHRDELLAGSVIIITGVAFVAVVAASSGGALILIPLVFFAELPSGFPAPTIAEATR